MGALIRYWGCPARPAPALAGLGPGVFRRVVCHRGARCDQGGGVLSRDETRGAVGGAGIREPPPISDRRAIGAGADHADPGQGHEHARRCRLDRPCAVDERPMRTSLPSRRRGSVEADQRRGSSARPSLPDRARQFSTVADSKRCCDASFLHRGGVEIDYLHAIGAEPSDKRPVIMTGRTRRPPCRPPRGRCVPLPRSTTAASARRAHRAGTRTAPAPLAVVARQPRPSPSTSRRRPEPPGTGTPRHREPEP